MADYLLYGAGVLGMTVSVVHAYLGQTRVVRPSQAPTAVAKRVISALVFVTAGYWFAAGALLIATPAHLPDEMRAFAAYGAALLFLGGGLGNLWATRGRHPGWVLLTIAAVLAIAGVG